LRTKRLLVLVGTVCLALMLVVPLAVSCGPATPEEGAEEIAKLESNLAAEKAKVSGLQDEVADLEDEIAALRAPAEVTNLLFELGCAGGMYSATSDYFKAELEKASGGRFVVEQVIEDAMVPVDEHLTATGDGIFDMLLTWNPYFKDKVPFLDVLDFIAYTLRTREDFWAMFEFEGWDEIMAQEYAKWNVHWIASAPAAPGAHLVSRVPIPDIASLDGLKIRATGLDPLIFEALGAGTCFLPGEEIYTALATGLVDAAAYGNADMSYSLGWHEVTKYWVQPSHASMDECGISANMDFWNNLSEADRAMIYDISQAGLLAEAYNTGHASAEAVVKAQEAGIVINYWDAESLKQWAMAALAQKPECRDEASTLAMDSLMSYIRAMGYIE